MRETHEELLKCQIAEFIKDMDWIAEAKRGERLKLKRTTAHLHVVWDDSNGLPIGMEISIDPRRLEVGEDGLGGDGTFLVRIYLSPKGYATFISELIAFAMEIGIDGDNAVR